MNNVALCLYGHFRTFDDCWKNLKSNIIDINSISDIFISSWSDSMGWFQHPENSVDHRAHPGFDLSSEKPSNEYIDSVLSKLNPRQYSIESFKKYEPYFDQVLKNLEQWHHPSPVHRPKGTLSQVWGRCSSIGLKKAYEEKHGFKYDAVIVTRWDIFHNKPIAVDTFDLNYVTLDGMYGPDVISDAWACGPSNLIDLWGLQFASISDMVRTNIMSLGPHEWLRSHFDYYDISWKNDPSINIAIKR